jgi:Amt family ammonium transporter
VLSVEFIDKVLRIDDPVGAISVHGVCGLFGTLCVGVFAEEAYGGVNGLLFGGGLGQFMTQLLGAAAVCGWVVVTMTIVFGIIKITMGLRVSAQEEVKGLDIEEHGMESYAGFQIFTTE